MKKIVLLLAVIALLSSCAQQPARMGDGAHDAASAYAVTSPGEEDSLMRIPGGNVYVLNKYVPSTQNIAAIKESMGEGEAVKRFALYHPKDENNALNCRATHLIYGPGKKPFSYLVESALNQELEASGMVVSKKRRVRATLDEMSLSTMDYTLFGKGTWNMRVILKERGKPLLVVQHEYSFPLSWMTKRTCENAMASMLPALQSLLHKIYTHPRFEIFVIDRRARNGEIKSSARFIQRKKTSQ